MRPPAPSSQPSSSALLFSKSTQRHELDRRPPQPSDDTGLRTEILARIEAECGRPPHRPSLPPAPFSFRKVLSAMSLTGVLHNRQMIPACELQDGIHIRGLTVKVHRNDRCDASAGLPIHQLSLFAIDATVNLNVFPEFLSIHVLSMLVDVHECRPAAGL